MDCELWKSPPNMTTRNSGNICGMWTTVDRCEMIIAARDQQCATVVPDSCVLERILSIYCMFVRKDYQTLVDSWGVFPQKWFLGFGHGWTLYLQIKSNEIRMIRLEIHQPCLGESWGLRNFVRLYGLILSSFFFTQALTFLGYLHKVYAGLCCVEANLSGSTCQKKRLCERLRKLFDRICRSEPKAAQPTQSCWPRKSNMCLQEEPNRLPYAAKHVYDQQRQHIMQSPFIQISWSQEKQCSFGSYYNP